MRKNLFFLCVVVGVFVTAVWCGWGNPKPGSSLPVFWSYNNIPIIEVSIDGGKQLVELCSCNKNLLFINERGYEQLKDTTQVGSVPWHDKLGNLHESPSYLVKSIVVGPITFSDFVVGCFRAQDDENYTTVWRGPNYNVEKYPTTSGELGWPFFAETSLLLDLGHDKIIIAKEDELRTKYGVFLDKMRKFALESDDRRFILKADSSIGPLRLEINTGATLNMIRPSLIQPESATEALVQKDFRGLRYLTMDLAIDTTTFERQRMYVIEVDDAVMSTDGFLGVDFLEDHLVYLDYPNKAAYIAP